MENTRIGLRILLIDDDVEEKAIVTRILKALTPIPFIVDQVLKCSAAITRLDQQEYDLVLLDNRLSERISARFSVPLIKSRIGAAPIIVISNDTSPDYLQNPGQLDIDHVVDKSDMLDFFRSHIDKFLKTDRFSPHPT